MKTVKVIHRVFVLGKPYRGHAVRHSEHGLVFILDGEYSVGGRISNFFHWKKIKPDGTLGRTEYCGYWGHNEINAASDDRITAVRRTTAYR